LAFLQKVEDVEEQVRHSCLSTDPDVKQKWFQMPTLNTMRIEQMLKNMKYKEKTLPQYGGIPFADMNEEEPGESSEEENF